jgi:predicted nucleic acid-binding Zn ribbon protein
VPTYLYQVVATGQEIEVIQSIKEPKHEVLEVDGELVTVKRLIASAVPAVLISGPSGGWASQGYSKPEHMRKAEQTLGRKLYTPNGGK